MLLRDEKSNYATNEWASFEPGDGGIRLWRQSLKQNVRIATVSYFRLSYDRSVHDISVTEISSTLSFAAFVLAWQFNIFMTQY